MKIFFVKNFFTETEKSQIEKTMSKYTPFSKEEIAKFKQGCVDNSGWKQIYRTDDVMVFTQKTEGSVLKFKCITKQMNTLEPEYIFSAYCDREYCKTTKTNDVLFDVVEKLDCCNEIIHRVQKMPMMDARDFVYQLIRYHNKDKTDYILYSKSVDSDIPPVKGSIRGQMFVQGTLITKISTGTLIYSLSHIDMNGKIPSALTGDTMVKQMTKKMMKRAKKNVDGYQKWADEHKDTNKWWLETLDWMME
ncbi:START domain containing protein [Entamoeba histolytica HM-1:IMSS-B]|uniref:START domain containing protein n=3 Tax=Entamoeba histolytica TaxID=5759 RepID=M3U6A6_ENTH1|nr:START domain containing protein [Entamoeba histolytica HM-1:IMSS-B]